MNIRTFMSGVIALLPIAATLAIVAWAGGFIYSYFGPGSAIGRLLTSLGLGLVGSPLVAYLVGLVIVAILIYALGVMVESSVAPRLYGGLDTMMQRIPLVGMVYDLSKRFVGMLDRKDAKDLKGMSPVWCFLGGHGSAAVLALLPKPETIMMAGEPYHVVLVPFGTDPVRRNVDLRAGEVGGAGGDASRRPDEHLRVDGGVVAAGGARPRCSGRRAAAAAAALARIAGRGSVVSFLRRSSAWRMRSAISRPCRLFPPCRAHSLDPVRNHAQARFGAGEADRHANGIGVAAIARAAPDPSPLPLPGRLRSSVPISPSIAAAVASMSGGFALAR